MTTLIARQPLQPLSMSSTQRGPRRLSARLQEKDDAHHPLNGVLTNGRVNATVGNSVGGKKTQEVAPPNNKKRKIDYDEEDDGFLFTRVKKPNPRTSTSRLPVAPEVQSSEEPGADFRRARDNASSEETSNPPRKRRNKMSFSTPKTTEQNPTRRSKRLSAEQEVREGSPQLKPIRKDKEDTKTVPSKQKHDSRDPDTKFAMEKTPGPATRVAETTAEDHSATRIALPFADTPVIRRNKAMREGKTGKGERRSSLGLRGRRASSLIESGSSNALPHPEVDIQEFYKHIESESLPEPKRMRQLLTWCATRALGGKPVGTDFEDSTVKQAAWIIQGELLKDFANKSAMSDWFSREDAPEPTVPLVERPHPKNTQNLEKIQELEEQIKRLRAERDSLESLLRPPVLATASEILPGQLSESAPIDKSLLSASDAALLDSLGTSLTISSDISSRLNSIGTLLEPTIDAFADGIHKMGQYRDAAESVASRTLAICADKLAEREREGRRRALQQDGDRSPRRDLGSVLRALTKVER